MDGHEFKEANGFFYHASATDVGDEIYGVVEFMRKSQSGNRYVPGVTYTLKGPFRRLDEALAAADQEGYNRAMSGDVDFD
jgi:hypothetical protein